MLNEAMTAELEARGVYWARYTKNGRPVCYAVDSKGEIVRRYVVMNDSRCEAAIEALWAFLDTVDPQPRLYLVTDSPGRPLPSTVRRPAIVDYDPYNLPLLPHLRRF